MTIIRADRITFSYSAEKCPVLRECSLSIESGELVSILGPNGAGKSTLLNCCCGLLRPQNGEIRLCGQEIGQISVRETARIVSYVQQYQSSVFAYTVFDYVLMGCAARVGAFSRPGEKERKQVAWILEEVGIAQLSDHHITEISGGEKQQAAIARALAQEPRAILFDEPTAHLDYGNQIRVLHMLKNLQEKGYAVVMTTHNPDHCLMLGGKVAVLDRQGTLKTGSCGDIIREDLMRDLYHADIKVAYSVEAGRSVCIPIW